MRFNPTEWALRHRSLVAYFMLVIAAAGVWSYLRLGRSEDPDFTVKTMVVQASWPGATLADTLEQVTDRIESKLQETPSLDYLKSYTSAGQTTIFVNLKDSTRPSQVPDIWYQVRKKVRDIANTLPQGIVGPGFNDEFGDTYGIVYGFTADGFTDRELRDYVVDVRKQLLQLPDISKIDILGAQDERVYVEFSEKQLAGLGIDRSALIAALQAQNAVTPAGIVQTGNEKILVRVSGAFRSEQDVLAVNFVAKNGRIIRLGDIAHVTRGPADPVQPMFRVNGRQGIGLAIAMRKGGDVLALGRNVEHAMAEVTTNLPVGIEPTLIADQPVTVEHAVDEFMEALWEAIAIRPRGQPDRPRPACGRRRGALDPACSGGGVRDDDVGRNRPSANLAGRPRYRARSAGRRRHDHHRSDGHAAGARRRQGAGGHLRLRLDRPSEADRHAGHDRGVRPDRVRGQRRGRIHLLDFRRRRHRVDRVVVSPRRCLRRCSASGFSKKPKVAHPEKPGPIMRVFRRFLALAMRARLVDGRSRRSPCSALGLYGMRFIPQQFFPSSDRPELLVDLQLPENASIYATQDISAQLDKLLKDDQDVDHWSTYVGQGAVRFYLPLNVQLPNDFFAQLVVVTKGLRAARARQGEAGAGAGHGVSECRRTGLSAGTRAAGRLAVAIPGERSRARAACAPSPSTSRKSSTTTRAPATSTTTGWSRHGRCAYGSIRTRHGSSGSARRPSPRP